MTSQKAQQASQKIKGPVFPIVTSFNADGSVDVDGIAAYVRFLLSQGAQNLMCTVGTSRYDVLTPDEMKLVNQTVVSAAQKEAYVIVTTPSYGPTSLAVEFAQHAESIGADAILAVYPDRYYGDESIVGYFSDVAESVDIGVMIHEMPIRAGKALPTPSMQYSKEMLEQIFSQPNMVGLKEESGSNEVSEFIVSEYSDKAAIIGGRGGMSGFRWAQEFGQTTYLVGVGNFIPRIELDFYEYLMAGENHKADQLIASYEKPFFDFAVSNGWHVTLKAAMFISNLCQRHERKPMPMLDDDKLTQLKQVMGNIGFTEY